VSNVQELNLIISKFKTSAQTETSLFCF